MADDTLKVYDVGVPCKKGHTTGRYIVSKKCVTCAIDAALAWNKANPEAHRKHSKTYALRHPEILHLQSKRWRTANADRVAANNARWQAANWEKYLSISSGWKAANRPTVNASSARRRLSQVQRTPAWLTEDDHWVMREAYALAAERTKKLGFSWHVDHRVPLRGRTVSGLHVPWNLRVIPGAENVRKGNRYYE